MNIIVNADDYGCSTSINRAISSSFKQGIISQTTIMINMPAVEDGITLSKQQGFFNKVGLHLNLTEGLPLTEGIKNSELFTNSKGEFNASLINCQKYRFLIPWKEKKYIKEEINAQMIKYKEIGFSLLHLDSHHHIHNNISLLFLILNLAKKNGFKSIRICRNMGIDNKHLFKMFYKFLINRIIKFYFNTVNYFGSYNDYKKSNYKDNIEIMVHPDIRNSEIIDVIKKGEKWERIVNYNYSTILSSYKN